MLNTLLDLLRGFAVDVHELQAMALAMEAVEAGDRGPEAASSSCKWPSSSRRGAAGSGGERVAQEEEKPVRGDGNKA
jgi:hypothetical protein